MPPCYFCPDGTYQHAQRDTGNAGVDQAIGHLHQFGFVVDLLFPDQIIDGDQCGGAEDGIGEHIDDDVRGEPGALKCRHQHLVMDIGFYDIDNDKYRGEQGGKREYPFVVPPQVGEQSGYREEERVPESCLSHGT